MRGLQWGPRERRAPARQWALLHAELVFGAPGAMTCTEDKREGTSLSASLRELKKRELVVAFFGGVFFAGGGLGEFGEAVLEFAFFEVGEYLVGAEDDFFGEAGEAGDVDAVAFVGGAGGDAAEEDDGVAVFADLNGVVLHAVEGDGEVG